MRWRSSQLCQLCEGAPLLREGPREQIASEVPVAVDSMSDFIRRSECRAVLLQRHKKETQRRGHKVAELTGTSAA
jgi:hypothetical protein